MATTKTPFFSLSSRGTIGSTLTTQKKGSATLVRTKPTPTYRQTLPQLYQRWLYEDYCHLWTLQTAATKAQYRSWGVVWHLTAFQYWMKDMLTRLPDIAAYYHMDEQTGPLAIDSSKNLNTATIFGASSATGIIDGAYYFDGLNDYWNCGTNASLEPATTLCIRTWAKRADFNRWEFVLGKWSDSDMSYRLGCRGGVGDRRLDFRLSINGIERSINPYAIDDFNWHRLIATYDGHYMKLYKDTVLLGSSPEYIGTIDKTIHPLYIGRNQDGYYWKGTIDDTRIDFIIPDQLEIARDFLRRYPLQ